MSCMPCRMYKYLISLSIWDVYLEVHMINVYRSFDTRKWCSVWLKIEKRIYFCYFISEFISLVQIFQQMQSNYWSFWTKNKCQLFYCGRQLPFRECMQKCMLQVCSKTVNILSLLKQKSTVQIKDIVSCLIFAA